MEGTLTARIAVLEGERDEAGRREAESRRRAKEAVAARRTAEGELEEALVAVKGLEDQVQGLRRE
ncbi:hypothetical protein LTR53_019344, partial [Teratosphaeriaceae sp. CCFEE 6253]